MENDCLVRELIEDNEGIASDLILDKLGSASESKVQANGSHGVENSDRDELNLKGADVELKPDVSTPTPTRKGFGLKKWRRIKRDVNRDGDSGTDAVAVVAQDSPREVSSNPSKRAQKSEGSVSSTNAVVRNFDGSALLDESSLGLSPLFAAGTDSENSEDRSSKSSTAASAPRMRYEIPVIGGFPRDKSKISSYNGKNLTHAVQYGQHGKGRIEASKKARGERVKIEKENSHSSVESDSRSFNFVFMQGAFSLNNGRLSEGINEYDGQNGDEVQGIGKQGKDGNQSGYGNDSGRGGFEDFSPEEENENHGPIRDKDPLSESMRALQSAQEALEAEVLKFKEIGNDVSVDGPVSDLCYEFIDVEQKLQETSGEGSQSFLQSQRGTSDVVTELEDLFKQKVEAELEYLVLSRTVQKMRVAAVDQITALEEQKALSSVQTQVLHQLGDAEHKAASLKKQADKLENFCEEIASADEILKLQKGAFKHGSCFVMQLVLLFVILGVFILQFSGDYVEVVPT
ncbi:WPP domain-interacting protein 2-like [Salvia splendens]|uniref:WPP domain-interacting protein 2-like n=1 Tax=Salvia splendens TaxID=180675 RepID=UPI001C26E7F9|nr:WPP domain-interacting protein 2-like [Salvia splendens]